MTIFLFIGQSQDYEIKICPGAHDQAAQPEEFIGVHPLKWLSYGVFKSGTQEKVAHKLKFGYIEFKVLNGNPEEKSLTDSRMYEPGAEKKRWELGGLPKEGSLR